MSLGEQLNWAKLVLYDERTEFTFAWYGGHGVVHVYTDTGEEIDVFNAGEFADGDASEDQIIAAIKERQIGYC